MRDRKKVMVKKMVALANQRKELELLRLQMALADLRTSRRSIKTSRSKITELTDSLYGGLEERINESAFTSPESRFSAFAHAINEIREEIASEEHNIDALETEIDVTIETIREGRESLKRADLKSDAVKAFAESVRLDSVRMEEAEAEAIAEEHANNRLAKERMASEPEDLRSSSDNTKKLTR